MNEDTFGIFFILLSVAVGFMLGLGAGGHINESNLIDKKIIIKVETNNKTVILPYTEENFNRYNVEAK